MNLLKIFKKRKGWWNMTEEEIRNKAGEDAVSAFNAVMAVFIARRFRASDEFINTLMAELEKAKEGAVRIQLQAKEENDQRRSDKTA